MRRSLGSLDGGRLGLPLWLSDAITLLGFSSGLIALSLTLRNSIVVALLLLGSLITALAGGWIMLVHMVDLWRSAREELESRGDYEFQQHGGDLTFIEEVIASGRRTIGHAHPDAKTVATRLKENPEVLRVYSREKSNGSTKFCGYVLLYPLKEKVGSAVLANAVRSEAELGPDPLCASFADAKHLYIGMLLGVDVHALAQVKDKLRTDLIGVLSAGSVEWVFARPGTKRGLSLMKRRGFKPISAIDDVWAVRGEELRRILVTEAAINSAIRGGPISSDSTRTDTDLPI